MITTIPITKARINLGNIVKRARLKKEYFILEKDGYPIAGLMDIDEFEDYLDVRNLAVKEQIKKSYAEYKTGRAKPVEKLLKALKKK
ncbi:type II toxin-antitoxin system Phd/YefM family antitoxin [Patescibacteria group bacterium]|nr:type II toxin-antitoxin system Phd/YefM family antitoxin [Patescibacteria group bacterium]MBU2219471.1 type II toxin-antitoxin system Phd/YefM family antitoxin [Patescibacteria group bacterium]MBU2263432.1 type II toxin-antitoxin system Phd/YefM family antitoxin [Patescibacteria group bacterium]